MKIDKSRIPICRSSYLEGISIELGRQFKPLRYACGRNLEFEVGNDAYDIETFVVSRRFCKNGYFSVDIWEDQKALYTYRQPYKKHEKAEYFRLWATLVDLNEGQIVMLIRDSLTEKTEAMTFGEPETAFIPKNEPSENSVHLLDIFIFA